MNMNTVIPSTRYTANNLNAEADMHRRHKALGILPTELLAKKYRKQMLKDVDALAKHDADLCRKNFIGGSGIQPGPITATAAGTIALIILLLINAELAARCFDEPVGTDRRAVRPADFSTATK